MSKLVLINDSHFIIDMMYARTDNMVQRAVYSEIGFGNVAYIHKDVYKQLLSLVPILEELNLKMRICDAYRPPLAHQKFLEFVPRSKAKFFVASPEISNHCHGTAIDVCLTDLRGNNLVYTLEVDAYELKFAKQVVKGKFDEFEKHLIKARHDYMNADKIAIDNRQFLRTLMETQGFECIEHEWWHYNLIGWQNYPMIDWINDQKPRLF
jgi:D-alanyl-D-alanine dipeptidase